jgi:AraC-like DNA-binding protein
MLGELAPWRENDPRWRATCDSGRLYRQEVSVVLSMPSPRFAPLIPTTDVEEFKAAPIGRCIVGASFAIWCGTSDLQGSIVWGELDEQSIREMIAIGDFIDHRDIAKRRRVLTDCRDVERQDLDVVDGFIASARDRHTRWSNGLERQVLIVPSGLGGKVMAGTLPLAGVEHPLRIAHDLESALMMLDHPAAAAAHAAASNIVAASRGKPALVSRLRSQLARTLSTATIESSAAALGMSTRTLQRELHRLDTSFSDELHRMRIAAAESLLVHTDLKIDTIALRLGFGTASRMSAWLRRERNLTASELRATRR